MGKELQKIESFRYALAVAETHEEISKIENATAAIAEFARRQKVSFDRQNDIGAFRIEIEEKKGQWLNEHFPHGSVPGESGKLRVAHDATRKMPANEHESARARLIAEAPKEKKEEAKKKIIKRGDIITPAKIERVLRKEKAKDKPKPPPIPDGEFNIIYADPPWQYEHIVDETRDIENKYPTDALENIKSLKIPVHKNSILFLWVPPSLIRQGLIICDSWGFDYRTHFVWDKETIGMGYFTRAQHELLFIARKGKMKAPEPPDRISSVYREKRTKHSKKPEFFYEYIEKAYPDGKYLELYARNTRPGWTSWGNEI